MFGLVVLWINGYDWVLFMVLFGLLWLFFMLYYWFGDVIVELEGGYYGKNVDKLYCWSMSWFIFLEVMFFGVFFGVLFYVCEIVLYQFGSFDYKLIWLDFFVVWLNEGFVVFVGYFKMMGLWLVLMLNIVFLLFLGVMLMILYYVLCDDYCKKVIVWLVVMFVFGICFLFLQGFEYYYVYNELNLMLNLGVYGLMFFLLIGFYGFYVFFGGMMFVVVLVWMICGYFKFDYYFVFEGVVWYWYFVDVVWFGLYVVVYWL